jgi:hypothetical protein
MILTLSLYRSKKKKRVNLFTTAGFGLRFSGEIVEINIVREEGLQSNDAGFKAFGVCDSLQIHRIPALVKCSISPNNATHM